MPDLHAFDDLPVLDELGDALAHAMRKAWRRRSWRRRWPRMSGRALAVAIAIAVPACAASAAGTLLVLRGDVIPAPRATAPEQTPRAGTSRLAAARDADPRSGQPPWSMRLATSTTGLLCSTVGQLVHGRFGIVGLDGRFRALADGVADSCSVRRRDAATLVGARVFTADRAADVRTVVSGVGDKTLRTVMVEARGKTRVVPVAPGGTFVAAFVGLPEDLGLRIAMTFADGHVERQAFGVGPMVFADPAGGHAWKTESGGIGGDDRTCVTVRSARERANIATSPAACGRLQRGRRAPRGLFFDVRRVTPGTGGVPVSPFGQGRWGRTPARLLVWGAAGQDVASIEVHGPAGAASTHTWFRPNGAFAFMFGPHVRPADVRVVVRFSDGRSLERSTSYNLVAPPTFGGGH
jgi:hypothetical protein